MAYPVTLNGRTYTLADFEGTNYVEGLPDAFEDFVTHAGDIYNSTSTTSNTIGTGSKTFTVESAKPYQAGTPLRIADAAAPSTNFIDAIVTSYSGTTLVVDSVGYAGSGTFTSWNVNIGGSASVAGTVAIAQGGTGATTAAAARTNLDVYSKADADSRFLNVSGEASDVTMTGNVTIGDAAGDTLTVNATADFNTGFNVDGSITSDGLTSAGIVTVQDNDLRIDLTAAPSAPDQVIGDLYFRSENSYGGRQDAGLIRSISASNWGLSREASMEFHTTYNSTMNKRMKIANNGDIVFYESNGSTASFLYDADVGAFFNYAGLDRNFRVSSENFGDMLSIDAENDKIGFGRLPLSGGTGFAVNEGAIQIHDNLGTVPLFINGGADYAGMKLKRDNGNNAGGVNGWNWTIRPSYAAGVAAGGDISYLKINSVYDGGGGGQQQHEVVINEDQYNLDFRLESDGAAHMLFVDASENKIGINQSSPSALLDVKGTSQDADGILRVYQSVATSNPTMKILQRGEGGSQNTDQGLVIDVAGHNQGNAYILNSYVTNSNINGGVEFSPFSVKGIGTFQFRQGGVINENGADSDFRVESDNNANMLFVDAGNDRIGILTSAPDAELHISSSHPHIDLGPVGGNRAKLGFRYDNLYLGATSAGGEIILKNNIGSTDAPDASGDEIARFGDNVVINESGRDQDFRLEGNNVANGLVYNADDEVFGVFTNSTSATLGGGINFKRDGQNSAYINIGHNAGAGGGYSYMQFVWNGSRIGEITQNGTTGVTYVTTSDYRLKENVTPITSATERLKQLNPVRFNFIREADRTIDGFLAHEVQNLVPEAVSGIKDEMDEEGNPKYQGLDTSRLVPLLVATIKELETRIAALENV